MELKFEKLKLELIHVNPTLFWNKLSLKSSCGTSKKTKSVEMILRDVDLFQMFFWLIQSQIKTFYKNALLS